MTYVKIGLVKKKYLTTNCNGLKTVRNLLNLPGKNYTLHWKLTEFCHINLTFHWIISGQFLDSQIKYTFSFSSSKYMWSSFLCWKYLQWGNYGYCETNKNSRKYPESNQCSFLNVQKSWTKPLLKEQELH